VYAHNQKMFDVVKGTAVVYKVEALDDFASICDRKLYSNKENRQSAVKRLVSAKVSETGGLEASLQIYIGCHVMLKRNVSVSQGLVNGSVGQSLGLH